MSKKGWSYQKKTKANKNRNCELILKIKTSKQYGIEEMIKLAKKYGEIMKMDEGDFSNQIFIIGKRKKKT